nr:hypothetical protein [Streptomyces sp. TRM72054]
MVVGLDATIITAAWKKPGAAVTFKKTFGFHPLAAWCANTAEALAMLLRPGNAGANTVADHVRVLTDASGPDPRLLGREIPRPGGRGRSHPRAAEPSGSVEHHAAHSPLHRRLKDHRRRREGYRPPAWDRLGDLRAPGRQRSGGLLRGGADRGEHP